MDYEKKYNEALERARKIHNEIVNNEVIGFPGQITDIFPELRESEDEDERVRKALIDLVSTVGEYYLPKLEARNKMLAYLEKQKDASKAIDAVERIDKYIDEHLANAHDMKDSNPDKKYYRGWDDALGKMSGILQDVYSVKKKEESLRDFIDNFPYSDEQKEQKPVGTSDFKTKLAEYLQNNSPKDGKYVISSESILEMAKEELIKRGELQKPVEWSEEDERMLERAIHIIVEYSDIDEKESEIVQNWLKSLRPSWKPSEEQMEALQCAINACESEWAYQDDELRSLLNDLKKL